MDTQAKLTETVWPQLQARVDEKRDALITLTQDLVRFPTINPPGADYLPICEFLRDYLVQRQFEVQLIRAEGAPGDSETYPRWNVLARREGGQPGECVHFNGHIDVVEVGLGWTFDPFGGEVSQGRVYGRGTCDMKGGLAAAIIAAEAFLDICPEFAGAIEISGTADEESGGYGGVAYLAEQGIFDPDRVQHVIIPEPLHPDRVCLGHRGAWWAEIQTYGRIAHGAMPFLGDCAVRHMAAVLDAFETRLYPELATRQTDMPVIPEGARQSTMNINSIHGGQDELPAGSTGFPSHCVPDNCRVMIDRRFLAEESLSDVREEVQSLLEDIKTRRDGFSYDLRELHHVLPSMTDKDAPVVRSVSQSVEAVLGRPAAYVASPGTYDQKHIDRIGRLHNCIAYGPGHLELAHQPDEYIDINDMVTSAKVMAHTLLTLLPPTDGTIPTD